MFLGNIKIALGDTIFTPQLHNGVRGRVTGDDGMGKV